MTKNKNKNKNKKNNNNKSKKKNNNNASKQVVIYREPKPQKPQGFTSIGATIGHHLQKFGESVFKRITGQGDYKLQDNLGSMQTNCLFANAKNQPPTFSGSKSAFVFEHSEYVQDIIAGSAGAFNVNTFVINPGNVTLFPWLANISQNFETYEMLGCIFRFESNSGDAIASTNSALGTVMGSVFYDTSMPAPTNKASLLQYEGTVDAKSSENFLVGLECAPNTNVLSRLYVGTPAAGADPHMYNMGNLVIASQGLQATGQNIGELWVHYKIRFYVALEAPAIVNSMHRYGTAVTTSNIWGTLSSSIGQITSSATASTLTMNNLNSGQLYMLIRETISATSVSSPGYTGATFVGATAINGLFSGANNNGIAASTQTSVFTFVFKAISNTATFTFTDTTTYVGATVADTFVLPYDKSTS